MRRGAKAIKIFKSFNEQEASDIQYYINLSPEERQRIARELRERCYGANPRHIRDTQNVR
jgi:hypothetical protein